MRVAVDWYWYIQGETGSAAISQCEFYDALVTGRCGEFYWTMDSVLLRQRKVIQFREQRGKKINTALLAIRTQASSARTGNRRTQSDKMLARKKD